MRGTAREHREGARWLLLDKRVHRLLGKRNTMDRACPQLCAVTPILTKETRRPSTLHNERVFAVLIPLVLTHKTTVFG
jgi:hypothetical protein